MSGTGNDKMPTGAAPYQEPHLEHYPPPPPGPPPSHQNPPQHTNEIPIPEYAVPSYNPARPQFAPPPAKADEEGMYDEEPVYTQPHAHGTQQNAPAKHKPGWGERLSALGGKAAAPINMLANKVGSETFLPTTMDKECEKAARILRSFCKDGIYTDASHPAPPVEGEQTAEKSPKAKKNRTLLTIPSKVISKAVGLAIFTTGRLGFHVTGATGSGILIARLPDGSWSPPSGIQVHSVGAGFVIGVDIYDCVVVINTKEALEAFTRTRMSLGSDLAVVAGPWGAGGSLDFAAPTPDGKSKGKESEKKADEKKAIETPAGFTGGPAPGVQPQATTTTEGQSTTAYPAPPERKPSPFRQAISKPVYSYVKSRGFYAGVQIDGTVVTERKDANAAFYGAKVPVQKVLRGEVPAGSWQGHAKQLFDIVKGAEAGRSQAAPQTAPAPTTDSYAPPPAANVAAATAGMQQMHLGGGPATQTQVPPAPAQPSKAQEAAAEAAAYPPPPPGPPGYTEQSHREEMPPAYVDDGQARPPADSKSGH